MNLGSPKFFLSKIFSKGKYLKSSSFTVIIKGLFCIKLRCRMNVRVILFLLPCLVLSACLKPTDLQYIDFKNLRIGDLGARESSLMMDLEYYNPNNYGIQLKDGEVDVYINDRFLGRSVLDTVIQVPRKDTFLIPVKMDIDMKNIFTNMVQLIANPEVNVKLVGRTKIGKRGIFVYYPIKYEGKQKIKF